MPLPFYRPRDSPLHGLHPAAKVALALGVLVASLVLTHPLYLLAVLAGTVVLAASARALRDWWGFMRLFALVALTVVAINVLASARGATVIWGGLGLGWVSVSVEGLAFGAVRGDRPVLPVHVVGPVAARAAVLDARDGIDEGAHGLRVVAHLEPRGRCAREQGAQRRPRGQVVDDVHRIAVGRVARRQGPVAAAVGRPLRDVPRVRRGRLGGELDAERDRHGLAAARGLLQAARERRGGQEQGRGEDERWPHVPFDLRSQRLTASATNTSESSTTSVPRPGTMIPPCPLCKVTLIGRVTFATLPNSSTTERVTS